MPELFGTIYKRRSVVTIWSWAVQGAVLVAENESRSSWWLRTAFQRAWG
jgi:hypothetical protein